MADIDFLDLENDWTPIENFSGVFDGNGHSISNLYINADDTTGFIDIGLFGFFKGTIKNLCLSSGSIIVNCSKSVRIGSIAAYVYGNGTVENCLSRVDMQVNVTRANPVGGIIGRLDGYAYHIKNLGDISAEVNECGDIGGVIGRIGTARTEGISDLYNYGTVYVKNNSTSYASLRYTYVGGIVGDSCGKLSNCYNYGNVSAYSLLEVYAGGIAGTTVKIADQVTTSERSGEISDSRNAGNIFAQISGTAYAGYNNLAYAGGISADMDAGDNSKIHRCFNTGNITSKSIQEWNFPSYETMAQGIGSGIVSDCFNIGEIIASRISGSEYSSFPNTNAYSAAAGISCGGESITNCYNVGPVTAEGRDNTDSLRYTVADGIFCPNHGSGVWYAEESNIITGNTYSISDVDTDYGTLLSPSAMEHEESFVGFDFDSVWKMGETEYLYPMLQSLGDEDIIGGNNSSSRNLELISCTPSGGIYYPGLALTFEFNKDIELELVGADQQLNAIRVYEYDTDLLVRTLDLISLADFHGSYSGNTYTIDYAFRGLDPGRYYLTIDEGFFRSATPNDDGTYSYFAGVSDKTLYFYLGDKIFTFHGSNGKDISYSYSYSDSYFEEFSNRYNHELANMSLNLALSAFNSAEAPQTAYNEKVNGRVLEFYDEKVAAKNVRALLSGIGFGQLETSSYKEIPTTDSVGVAFGTKEIAYDWDTYTVIAVAIRGGGYEAEWGGNFTVGKNGNHTGFQTAADEVIYQLKSYINTQEIHGNLKIWVTGYSRAAATANLVAAALNNDMLFSGTNAVSKNDVSLDRLDIYAYTFETPQPTTNKNSSDYNNIFNIVNPVDPVPKVAPDGWSFTRYGVTYYMSSAENETFSNYHDIVLRVNNEYGNIVRGQTGYSSSVITALSNQGTILNKSLDTISVMLPRDAYSPKYEELIAPIVSELTGSGATDSEIIVSTITEFCLRHPVEAKKLIYTLKDVVGKKAFWFIVGEQISEQIIKYTGILDWTDGTTGVDTIKMLLDIIIQSHYPEVTLAWMRTINDADGFSTSTSRRLYVNCPVDISVYDSSDQLVAQIIGDEPQLIDNSLISAYVDGSNQKIIILPNSEEYRIVLSATDDGTVTYTATEFNIDTGNSERVVSYYEVEVKEGDELVGVAENLDEETAKYPLTLNGEEVEATLDQSGDDVIEYTVIVTASGNGSTFGGGTYVGGEFAKVTAEPDSGEDFSGWYVDNVLVSEDLEYRFLVEDSYEITARFTTNTNPGGTGSTSSSASSTSSYTITVATTTNGTVTVTPKSAKFGAKVTITAKPDDGYTIGNVTVTDSSGKNVTVTDNGDGTYTFTMPASQVTVSVTFTDIETSWTNPFIDVSTDAYYYDAVQWAAKNGITYGTDDTHFSPSNGCTRAQFVTFLWRAADSPEPASSENLFSDVSETKHADYYKAILWAAEQGVTVGTGNGTFSPDVIVTRAQSVTFMYRYAQKAGIATKTGVANFDDVSNEGALTAYYDAIGWAVANGITNGTGDGKFSPMEDCNRGMMITFLYRLFTGTNV